MLINTPAGISGPYIGRYYSIYTLFYIINNVTVSRRIDVENE